MRVTRRTVQVVLAVLWILDGLLQFQPQMLTSNFANDVILPAAQGQPNFVAAGVTWGANITLSHPAIFDALFGLIQLILGLGIFWKKTTKYALWASVGWAAIVWYLGEGFNGMLSGHTSLFAGLPGAVFLYGALALAVMPVHVKRSDYDDFPAPWLAFVWAAIWIMGAIYQALPGQNTVEYFTGVMQDNLSSGPPSWLAYLFNHTISLINSFIGGSAITNSKAAASSLYFIFIFCIIQAFVGIGTFSTTALRKAALYLGMFLSLVFWILGQALGMYYSGLATDPNTGPLFILMALAVMASPVTSTT